ncbi:MAG: MlaD family protein [Gemmataceae bacterium]
MAERGQKVRLGLFALGALLAIAALIIMFGKKPTWLETRTRYTVIFENAPGIQNGTPVRRSGVKIGEVADLQIIEEDAEHPENIGRVKVTLLVSSKFLPRANETPQITQNFLTGDSAIDFVVTDSKQKPSINPLPPGSEVPGRGPINQRESIEQVQAIIPTLARSVEKVGEAFDRFNKVAPDAENFLREYALLSRALREMVPELQRTNDSVRQLTDDTRATIPQFKQTNDQAQAAIKQWNNAGENVNVILMANREKVSAALDNFVKATDRVNRLLNDENLNNARDTLKNTKTATEKFEQSAQNFNESLKKANAVVDNLVKATQPLADSGGQITANVQATTADAQKLVAELRYLVQQFGHGNGTVQRLLTDPSLYNNANETALMLSHLTPRLEQLLANLVSFSDAIARHPEQLGLHGMFRPSAGLKGSPNAPTPWLQPR